MSRRCRARGTHHFVLRSMVSLRPNRLMSRTFRVTHDVTHMVRKLRAPWPALAGGASPLPPPPAHAGPTSPEMSQCHNRSVRPEQCRIRRCMLTRWKHCRSRRQVPPADRPLRPFSTASMPVTAAGDGRANTCRWGDGGGTADALWEVESANDRSPLAFARACHRESYAAMAGG